MQGLYGVSQSVSLSAQVAAGLASVLLLPAAEAQAYDTLENAARTSVHGLPVASSAVHRQISAVSGLSGLMPE